TQVVSTFNDTQREIPNTTLPELFAAQVERTPDAIALIFGDEEVSYRELDARANQLARYLISEGIGPEDIVAIALDRSIEMVVSLLGFLKSGAAYLPLDPEYPVERLHFMLTDSNAKRLITTIEVYERLLGEADSARTSSAYPDAPAMSYQRADAISSVFSSSIGSCADALPIALLLDDEVLQAELATLSNALIADKDRVQPLTPDNLAYVIYTSGTTGKPKGVATTVSDIVALAYQPTYCEITPASVILQYAPISFDAATFEIWGALLNGAELALAPSGQPDLIVLSEFMRRRPITTAWLTAGLFASVVENNASLFNGMKHLITGGDVVSSVCVRKLKAFYPDLMIYNGYGP
ncbi:MAG: AMP-binding protein, partial [Methylocystis sp.]